MIAYNEVRVFLEYHFLFKHISWLRKLCSSLAHFFSSLKEADRLSLKK